jgi:hypothetical protein
MGKKQAASAEAFARGGALFQPGDEFLSTAKAAEILDRSPKTYRFTGWNPCIAFVLHRGATDRGKCL